MNSGKYKIENNQIVNITTGVAIPDDEPVFILRAKDETAAAAVEFYVNDIDDTGEFYCDAADMLNKFKDWQEKNQDKIKEPD
jgi:hypothetical protein